jgi:hypothetical protein
MSIRNWTSKCNPSLGVEAEHVSKDDNPAPALDKEASRLCPMGYDKLEEITKDFPPLGKVIMWPIRCHTSPHQSQIGDLPKPTWSCEGLH